MTDLKFKLDLVNFELDRKFNDKFGNSLKAWQVSVAPGGFGIDLHDSEGNWVESFDDLHEVESEPLN